MRAMPAGPRRLRSGSVSSGDAQTTVDESPGEGGRGHLRRAVGGTKELIRIAYRDPAHIPERLTLHATESLAEASRQWAEEAIRKRPDATPAELAEDVRLQSAKIARIDGAIAGTPFYIALVPGYLSYLWQEARMGLRIAALHGQDPATMRTAAQLLSLRGAHPTIEGAEAALRDVAGTPPPVSERRPLRFWYEAIRGVLVFGGFLSPPEEGERPSGARERARAVGGLLFAASLWVTTCVFPLSFMIAMAWACETHSRQLGLRTLALYEGASATTKDAIAAADEHFDAGRTKRQVLRSAALGLSVAIPIGFVVYANHVRQQTGINGLGALGALVALSCVAAAAVYGSRR
jgi:hypothetical protein